MADKGQLEILRKGVIVWNQWREENPGVRIDLREADLVATDLRSVDLRKADLIRADLRGANLKRAFLSEACLCGANLISANFSSASLDGAMFSESLVESTVFASTDLSTARGLDEVEHFGPSHISTDTLVESKGYIPDVFLRGCGLSDWEIEAAKLYLPDLSRKQIDDILYRVHDLRAGQALQINSLFISYTHRDGAFVDKMEKHLNEKGVRFWRDIHDATSGRLEKVVDRAMRQNPTVLLVLSENSVKSDWVEHEARLARELGKELGRDVLCPVALDEAWKGCRWPERLREQIEEYHILDFSGWQEEGEFGRMFRKLIEGLDLFYKE